MRCRTVYAIKNIVTGRYYVGSTERTPSVRFKEHMDLCRRNSSKNVLMQNDYKVFGEATFILKIFGVFEERQSYQVEYALMDFLGSRKEGYNYMDIRRYKRNPIYDEVKDP